MTQSNMFCGGRGKRCAMVEKGKGSWQRIIVIIVISLNMVFFPERKDEDKRKHQNSQTWVPPPFSKLPFLNIYSAHPLVGACSFILVHIWFTPNDMPKDWIYWFFFIKTDHGSWTIGPWKKANHLPWSIRLHGPWREPSLIKPAYISI